MNAFEDACCTIDAIARELCIQDRRTVFGICGLGGSGKSTLCRRVAQGADYPCAIFEIDWYLAHSSRDRRCGVLRALEESATELDFWQDPTNWYDWLKFEADLRELRDTGYIRRSGLWRQSTGEKDLEVAIELPCPGVILCDGIYLLHPPLRSLFDKVLLLEASSREALERSAGRDSHRNPESYQAFKASVTDKFDVPYFARNKQAADIAIML